MSIPCPRKIRGGVVLAAALLAGPLVPVGLSAVAAPALAADAPASPTEEDSAGPDLAIQIDDGQTSVARGDRLAYTVKVRNIGTVDADDLVITQRLPPGTHVTAADRDGVIGDGAVTWHTGLPAGRATAFGLHAEVTKPPGGQLRLASVVCATAGDDARPIVCAADSDQLPAGGGAGASAGSHASSGLSGWLTALCVGVGVVMVLLAVVLVGRRRSLRRSARTGSGHHRAPAAGLFAEADHHEADRDGEDHDAVPVSEPR
ncbi:DUF11 domain-containing protein [Frankia sp. AgKG'84/4]|uniref:DUF11 domain-containing protein n=1 Tax=Frankia sp. AgKG'84/4 TaxID=573490 RepID=UPI00200C7D0B|nr:DUF11 domain-containing protein [Frankia sp. AgKG'84/4]MCL9794317.1 DUF11 domain-containing protein [Frankia sp. AgKG'84/4]